MKKNSPAQVRRTLIRCAIYTRKSTEEGLDQDFNSLDAQRESAQAYIASQQHEGWIAVHDRYDDGGFTGGNMERPALRRLLADIDAGKIDCVVVYKVDRLSRSLLDFARMMEVFDKHQVAFVAVTQQFNTASSMGRLVMNVLLSFAQFEREIISERTRDKIAAARRKGKWSGGMPVLGYDVPAGTTKLVVHKAEAQRVRQVFQMYLERQTLLRVVQELERLKWVNKVWQTRKGNRRGGKPFTKTSLHKLLTNVVYLGQVRYKTEVHPGEHPAIVEPELWQQVQDLLRQQYRTQGSSVRFPDPALLKGLLRCRACGCAMAPSHTRGRKKQRYRYYVCVNAQKRGWQRCPAPSVSAPHIERCLLEQVQATLAGTIPLDSATPLLQMTAHEQARTIQALVRSVEYDGPADTIAVAFDPQALASYVPQENPS